MRAVEDYLMHYGTKRHSGRYPWGSGDNPYQHAGDWYTRVKDLEKQGLSRKEVADYMEMTIADLLDYKSIAKSEMKREKMQRAMTLMEKGMSRTQAAKQLGLAESTLREYEKQQKEGKLTSVSDVAAEIRKRVDKKGSVDVGDAVEFELGCSTEVKRKAIKMLEAEGYISVTSSVAQAGTNGQRTNLMLIGRPDMTEDEVKDYRNIRPFVDYVPKTVEAADGSHPSSFLYPESLDSSRLAIRYDNGKKDATDGGSFDGTIEIRRGCKDLDLGDSNYAQVRIMVDNKYYLKGMAVYSDDLPQGKDIIFNTNKKEGTPMGKVLKEIKHDDPDNPFGSAISKEGQSWYVDANGNKKLSLINKCREEGEWDEWARKLPSQFLSKQNLELANRQMTKTIEEKKAELAEIKKLTNPVVKRKCLEAFADECDSNAVSLKTVALPGQRFQVILPLASLRDNECYAPNYEPGTKLALVRYPHGGIFEIPIVTVNNNNKEGKKKITPGAKDAIGINSKVAERLSGADFDGDTVTCIPLKKDYVISTRPPLSGLVGFDPKSYKFPDSMSEEEQERRRLKKGSIGTEMGGISNLITDMTLKGADFDEIERAVKHSMVVIDAHKHYLDYKQSAKDFNIAELKVKYQGGANRGASTIISKASSEYRVSKRQNMGYAVDPKTGQNIKNPVTGKDQLFPYDPNTGQKLYRERPEYYIDKKGKEQERKIKSTKMAETNDARTLLSPIPNKMELMYADYANHLKGLANDARKSFMATSVPKQNREATKLYKEEVDSLNAKLLIVKKNQPKERHAQILARSEINAKKADNPELTLKENKDALKKLESQAIRRARASVGAERHTIDISEREWEAIQNNAISSTKLREILDKTDMDQVRKLAMPRENKSLSSQQISMIKSYSNSGYTNNQIADKLGISVSTVINAKKK